MSESDTETDLLAPLSARDEPADTGGTPAGRRDRLAPSYAVVVPAYNEGPTIGRIAGGALAFTPAVIVVDDGSTDDTARQAARTGARVIRHAVNLGKGRSLLHGMRAALDAGARAVITIDGDLQHDPADIPRFIAAAEGRPDRIILGNRYAAGAAPPLRRAANRFADFWISRAARAPVADSQCGFRLYPRSAVEDAARRGAGPDGFAFESEILIDAARRGIPIASVGIAALYPEHPNRASHYRPVADTARITAMVTRKILVPGR